MVFVVPLIATSAYALTSPSVPIRYNIMYFIADDLRPEFLGPYKQSQMITPSIDKLAETGLTFNHAYCQQAVCGPTRASFMTGRRPSHTNIYDNKADFRISGGPDRNKLPGSKWTTLPEHFKNSGFTTLGGGKTFHPNHPKNWDEPTSWSQDMDYFPYSYFISPNKSYSPNPCPGAKGPNPGACASRCPSNIDTWCAINEKDDHFYDHTLANNTIKQLRYVAPQYHKEGKPFFIQSGFARPHAPWRVPRRIWDLYENISIPLAKNKYPPENMPGVAWYQDGFYDSKGNVHMPTITTPIDDDTAYNMRRAYYSAVTWMDQQLGLVLTELENLNLQESTIVLLHGDHGWQLGEHNSWHKFTNFELATRVPLVIRAPFKSASIGKVTNTFAELVDIYQTLSDLSGAGLPQEKLDGTSLAPLFDDPSMTSLDNAFPGTHNKTLAFSQYPHSSMFGCEFFRSGNCYNSNKSSKNISTWMGYTVRSHVWRYTAWIPGPDFVNNWGSDHAYYELYNHSHDYGVDFDSMDEPSNLAYDPFYVSAAESMHSALYEFFHDMWPPNPSPSPSPPSCNASEECHRADGILADDKHTCCPIACGRCGGKHCGTLPLGKDSCCKGEVERNGKSCMLYKAPCIVEVP